MFDQISKFANDTATSVTDAVKEIDLGEQFTTTSDQVLDTVLDVNRRIVDVAVSNAERVELPFADRFPTPAATGERYLEVVERAVSANRDFNRRIAEMIAADNARATAEKLADTATTATKRVAEKVPTTSAKKTPAKKAPAKRAAKKSTVAKKSASTK